MQNKAIEADIYLIFIGYFVVIAYVMITTGKYNCRDQKVGTTLAIFHVSDNSL